MISAIRQVVLLCSVLFVFVNSAKLPSYLKPCSKSDPKLNQCAIKHAREGIPTLAKGDNAYHIPNLIPLRIPEVRIQSGENLKIIIKDAVLTGLDKADIQDMNIDLENRKFWLKANIDYANLVSDYEIDGRILILPIKGSGPANITYVGGVYKYSFDFDLVEKNGKQHIKTKNNKLDYTVERAYYQLDNLFGGDKALGQQMNIFLNENWKDVDKDLGPSLTEAISQIIQSIVTAVFTKVPFDYIFDP